MQTFKYMLTKAQLNKEKQIFFMFKNTIGVKVVTDSHLIHAHKKVVVYIHVI